MKKIIIPALFILLFCLAAALALFVGTSTADFVAITAVAAFGISLFNFYNQHFRSVHGLSCTLVAIGYNGSKFTAHYTFENTGTHQEIVVGGTFVFPREGEGELYTTLIRPHNNSRMPEMMVPFIIKPKDVILKEFIWEISYDVLMIHLKSMNEIETIGMEAEFPMSIKLDFVDPKRRNKSSKLINCADIKFTADFAYCSRQNHQSCKLFNRINGVRLD